MKFPGKRKSKHYFPVNARDPLLQSVQAENEVSTSYIVGIDQTLVDIEAKVDEDFITRYGLSQGHSLVIEDDVAERLYQELTHNDLITHEFAGGTIAILCIIIPCWLMTALFCLALCAAILKSAVMPIAIYVIPPAVPI